MQQRDLLYAMNCDYAQGFVFRALPALGSSGCWRRERWVSTIRMIAEVIERHGARFIVAADNQIASIPDSRSASIQAGYWCAVIFCSYV
jgi:hypothetical protein